MARETGWKISCVRFRSECLAMSSKTGTLDVTIMGRTYKVACPEHERDELLRAVDYLDAKMNQIKSDGKVASAERIAVMAALNIANELLAARNVSPGDSVPGFDLNDARRRMQSMQAVLDEALAAQEKLL